jgi:SAM-dependent methyltransferase
MNYFDHCKFWQDIDGSVITEPIKGIMRPDYFIGQDDITQMVVNTLSKYLTPNNSILELGCGSCRDLAGLAEAGFSNLTGIEINQDAIDMGRETFPSLKNVNIRCAAIENVINLMPKVDCIFSMGVLMHLPPESDWIYKVMSRKADKLIMTMEMELPYHGDAALGGEVFTWFRGSYEDIFYPLGWKQTEGHSCEDMRILSKNHWLRVYERME